MVTISQLGSGHSASNGVGNAFSQSATEIGAVVEKNNAMVEVKKEVEESMPVLVHPLITCGNSCDNLVQTNLTVVECKQEEADARPFISTETPNESDPEKKRVENEKSQSKTDDKTPIPPEVPNKSDSTEKHVEKKKPRSQTAAKTPVPPQAPNESESKEKHAEKRPRSKTAPKTLISPQAPNESEPNEKHVEKKKPRVKRSKGDIVNDDICFLCRDGGVLVCCDSCEKSYHFYCHVPPMLAPPRGKFNCMECTAVTRAKRSRCGRCQGCLNPDCGVCRFCQDKLKFGGQNKLRSKCVKRECINLNYATMVPNQSGQEQKILHSSSPMKETTAPSKGLKRTLAEIEHKESRSQEKNRKKPEKKQKAKRLKIPTFKSVSISENKEMKPSSSKVSPTQPKMDINGSAKFTIVDLGNW
eukprot:CAMPEP_0197832224 /NCGR_PEP_ID=MMETSP1437-20131217/13806_1 /TAXON_ID=49252 ORGANISM="Eucampia antarctica, Strain CCMP1452" /NCGR_SAMPLE_ID=MMETSP1437 /ASSEMBLY_ACC=CAM_ASM_001096 /LENGTH=414 /DNA_ID=CAMNT_0043435469 /DNA_START=102 /DNA_END=1343 /DNA_ORIENTATION=+